MGDYCKYWDKGNPYLVLQPIKTEVLLDEPIIHVYHDVVSEAEVDLLKQEAKTTVSAGYICIPDLSFLIHGLASIYVLSLSGRPQRTAEVRSLSSTRSTRSAPSPAGGSTTSTTRFWTKSPRSWTMSPASTWQSETPSALRNTPTVCSSQRHFR